MSKNVCFSVRLLSFNNELGVCIKNERVGCRAVEAKFDHLLAE